MRIVDLKYVLAVEQYHGFSPAAKRLHIAQSAVSNGVARLEREIGFPIFNRQRRNMIVTPNGELFLSRARVVVEKFDALQASAMELGGRKTTEVRIGLISNGDAEEINEVLAQFIAEQTNIHVFITSNRTKNLIESVRRGDLDLGIVSLQINRPPSDLEVYELWRERAVAVVPPDHEIADLHSVNPHRLSNYVIIDFPEDTGIRTLSDRIFLDAGQLRRPPVEVSNAAILCALVRHHAGVGILGERYAALQRGLVSVPIQSSLTRAVYIVSRSDAPWIVRLLAEKLATVEQL